MNTTPALILPVHLRYESKDSTDALALPLPPDVVARIEDRLARLQTLREATPDVRELHVDVEVDMRNLALSQEAAWKSPLGKRVKDLCKAFRPAPIMDELEAFTALPWRFHESAWLRLREDGFTIEVKANASPNFPPMASQPLSYAYLTLAKLVVADEEAIPALFDELSTRDAALAGALLRGDVQLPGNSAQTIRSALTPESLAGLLAADEVKLREAAIATLSQTKRTGRTR